MPGTGMSQSGGMLGEQGEREAAVWRCSPSGALEPCFMIFLYLERLFWNQILTCGRERGEWGRWGLWLMPPPPPKPPASIITDPFAVPVSPIYTCPFPGTTADSAWGSLR